MEVKKEHRDDSVKTQENGSANAGKWQCKHRKTVVQTQENGSTSTGR